MKLEKITSGITNFSKQIKTGAMVAALLAGATACDKDSPKPEPINKDAPVFSPQSPRFPMSEKVGSSLSFPGKKYTIEATDEDGISQITNIREEAAKAGILDKLDAFFTVETVDIPNGKKIIFNQNIPFNFENPDHQEIFSFLNNLPITAADGFKNLNDTTNPQESTTNITFDPKNTVETKTIEFRQPIPGLPGKMKDGRDIFWQNMDSVITDEKFSGIIPKDTMTYVVFEHDGGLTEKSWEYILDEMDDIYISGSPAPNSTESLLHYYPEYYGLEEGDFEGMMDETDGVMWGKINGVPITRLEIVAPLEYMKLILGQCGFSSGISIWSFVDSPIYYQTMITFAKHLKENIKTLEDIAQLPVLAHRAVMETVPEDKLK